MLLHSSSSRQKEQKVSYTSSVSDFRVGRTDDRNAVFATVYAGREPPSMLINPHMEEKSHQKTLTNVAGSFEVILQKIRQQFRYYVGDTAGLDKQLGEFYYLYSN
jgi:hypothetical protein